MRRFSRRRSATRSGARLACVGHGDPQAPGRHGGSRAPPGRGRRGWNRCIRRLHGEAWERTRAAHRGLGGSDAGAGRRALTPPAAEGYQQWDRADLPQPAGLGLGIPHDVVAFRGTLLIVGGAETGPCAGVPCVSETAAAVWRLKGGAWERQPDQPGLRAGAMASAVATTHRLLILGETTSSPRGTGEGLVWPESCTLTDGVTFTARDAPAQFTAIVAPGPGFVVFLAAATTDAVPEIWSSADGLAWHREVDAATLGAGAIRRMRVVGGQVIAVGAETIHLEAAR